MLVTFVIGLREGLEAALIIAIIAAFLLQNSGRRALRPMWIGVGASVSLCVVTAAGLSLIGRQLPEEARETLEGALTLIAVAGVSYMLVWMRHNSRGLKSELQTRTARALGANSAMALVALAFFAVMREGFETAVFLLGVLTGSSSPAIGLVGAGAGIGVAALIGYGIFRGGVHIDLNRFFRVTGILLVLVAAGLVSAAIHEFAEAGLFPIGQAPAVDLSALIAPGSIRAAMATAFLGFQPVPTYAELLAWLVFLVPATWYVLRPNRTQQRLAA